MSEQVIGAAYEIYRVPGYGFLEKAYQRAMQAELINRGVKAELESRIKVVYKGTVVGDSLADLFVEKSVLVELKVARTYNAEDEPQLLNEMKATGIKVGLLIDFGRSKVEFRRFVS